MEDFRKEFELIKSLPYWKYVRRSPNPSKKEEGGLIELINPYIENNDIPEFKEGGNIINEDSLLNPEDFT
jgi:hypothetical protein